MESLDDLSARYGGVPLYSSIDELLADEAASRDEVSLRLDTQAGKGRTYDFDLVNMTQCYRAAAHDKFAYKPRAIKRYEFGTPEWSEYVRANHESSLRNISD